MKLITKLYQLKRINGFTLIELSVAMLISGIAVAAALGAYLTIEQYYLNSKTKNQTTSDILIFYDLIRTDIQNADYIKYNNLNLILTEKNAKTTEYIFDDYNIIRKKINIDTFKIESELLKIHKSPDNEEIINGIDMIVLSENVELELILRKTYSEEQLFQREIETVIKNKN